METKIITPGMPESAVYESRTLTGWWSRPDDRSGQSGFYDKDESLARYAGSTHKRCEKHPDVVYAKNSFCRQCSNAYEDAKFNKLEIVKWDRQTPLAIYMSDYYFFDEEDLYEYCNYNEVYPSSLRLVLCKPIIGRLPDSDWWHEDLPEDTDLPKPVQEAVDALCEALKANSLGWIATNKRLDALKEFGSMDAEFNFEEE